MWSKWQWVIRIASTVEAQLLRPAARIRSGLVAGVDDQGPVGVVAAQQVAVLGHRADGEHADVHQRSFIFARWRRRHMKRSM